MSDEDIKRILIIVTLDIAKRYGTPDELFQRIMKKIAMSTTQEICCDNSTGK